MNTHTQPERLRCEVCDMPTWGDTLCNLHYEEQEKMSTNTPGPYTIHDTDDAETVELWDRFGAFASCEKRQAALLSAAPALLEALKQCIVYIQKVEDDGQANSMILLPDSATLATAKEALRLAEGKA